MTSLSQLVRGWNGGPASGASVSEWLTEPVRKHTNTHMHVIEQMASVILLTLESL